MAKKTIYLFSLFVSVICINAQDLDWGDFLFEEVPVENPVYKPVIGIGGGMMNYWGDIKDESGNVLLGYPALKINISTFADNAHYLKINFYGNVGNVGKNSPFNTDTTLFKNSAFKTSLWSFGINLDYGFGHLFQGKKKIRPFVAAGLEFINFNARGDLTYDIKNDAGDVIGNEIYHAWTDGTIRNYSQNSPPTDYSNSMILQRDEIYETNFSSLYTYAQQGFAIPFEAGLDFTLTDRSTLRFATSLNFTFTDYLDGYKPTSSKGFFNNDRYIYTYATFSVDLFSDDETKLVENVFADITDFGLFDFDDFSDADNDGIVDNMDDCLNTPATENNLHWIYYPGTIDSLGCPTDTDEDGVPDYMDKELNSAKGAFVDKDGITLTDDELIAMLDASMALNRADILKSHGTYRISKYAGIENLEIPEEYKFVDANGDGYISFFELLQAIDEYFDYKTPLTSDELLDLNDFFFAQ